MKKMTLQEFLNSGAGRTSSEYIYSTENQDGEDEDKTARYSLKFNDMLISFAPNVVCLKSELGYFLLKRVKYVLQGKTDSAGDTVINFVCGDKKSNNSDRIHTVIMRQ